MPAFFGSKPPRPQAEVVVEAPVTRDLNGNEQVRLRSLPLSSLFPCTCRICIPDQALFELQARFAEEALLRLMEPKGF